MKTFDISNYEITLEEAAAPGYYTVSVYEYSVERRDYVFSSYANALEFILSYAEIEAC